MKKIFTALLLLWSYIGFSQYTWEQMPIILEDSYSSIPIKIPYFNADSNLTLGNNWAIAMSVATDSTVVVKGYTNGSLSNSFLTTTTSVSIPETVKQITVGTQSAGITLTLPSCGELTANAHFEFFKSGTDTYPTTITTQSGEFFIDGQDEKILYSQSNTLNCTCNGTAWFFGH